MDIIQGINRSHGLAADQTQGSNVDPVVVALRGKLERACERLSKDLYNSQSHFILEFVQNADDNHYDSNVVPTLNLRMWDREMVIECNEKGFDEDNVKAICDIGASTKAKVEGYIGEKGIGFKAVFVVAQQVHVASRHFMFRFERDGTLGMINPIWDTSYPINHGWTTFHLQLAPVVDRSDLKEQIGGIQPSLLLFLRKLRSIDIDIAKGKKKRSSLVSVRRIDETGDIIRLERHENYSCVSTRRYFVVNRIVNTYAHEEKRRGIDQSEIVLAFPINNDGQPEITHQYVHAFLPVATYGLNLVVQGDFLTSSSREDIIADSQWNHVLLEGVTKTFLAAVERLRQHHKLRDSWMRYIPLNARGPFNTVQDSIVQALRARPVLRDILDRDQLPTNLITIPTELKFPRGDPLIGTSDLPSSTFYISGSYDVNRDWSYLSKLGVTEMSTQQFLGGLRKMDRRNGFARCSEEWHEVVCRHLHGVHRWQHFEWDIRNLRILPLVDGTWDRAASASEYCFPGDLELSHLVGLQFISSKVRPYTSRYTFFEALGVRPANASVVANHILQSKRRYSLSDMVRIAQFFYNHRDDRDFPSPSHLAVMDEDESEALGNDLYLDVTTSGGSLRSMLPHARFIHAAYKPPTPFQMSSWRSWLRDRLGVHTQPRIVGGRLSPEFREMVKSLSAAPSKLLRVLQEYWHYISEEVSPDGLEELSQVAVVCMDGARHKLAETALRRRSLSLAQIPSQCLHFVDAPNPDDHQWDFLAKLGVMLEPNAHAWLEVLKRLQMTAQPSPASLTPMVEEAYKQLDARFNEASGDIRRAFREYPLLLLTSRDDGDVSTKCQWIGMNGAYWHGPSYLKDILIEPSYPWMKEFFVDRLGLASLTPPSVVIDRLLRIAETEADKPLPQSVQNVVEDILLTLSEWRVQPLTSAADIASQLKRLKDKAIFPVKATDSGLVTLRRVDGFYVHRGQLKEAEMVMGRVPLLATTLKLRIPDIQPLLDGDMWSTSVKYLEPPVLDIQYGFRGEFEPCTSLRERFTDPLRLECIRSTICYKLGRRSRWRESRELQFADKLQTLTIGIVDAIMLTISLPAEKISHETYLPSHLEETDDALVLRIARESISTADGEFTLQLSRHLSGVGIDLCRAIIYVQQPLQTVYNILREEGIDIIHADYLDDDGHTFHWGENQHMQLQPVLSESGSVKERLAARDDHGVTSGTGSASSTTIAHTAPQSGQQSLQTSVIETRSHRSLADQVDDAVHDLEKNFSVISLDADAVYTPESLKNTQSEVDLPSMVTSISRPKASKSSLGAAASTGIPGTDMSDLVAAPAAATNRAAETTAEASGTVGRISTGATSGIASLFVALASPAAAFDSISDHQIINGIMGERYAYEVLRKLLGPNFGPDNWTSELRGQVPGFTHYEGDSLADFRCPDDDGILTRLWYGGEVKQRWQSDWPTYHIEVKSTSRSSEEPFHMKRVQLRTASRLTGQSESPESTPRHVYVLMRVFDIRSSPAHIVFLDPHRCVYKGGLVIESDVEMCVNVNMPRNA